MIALMSAKSSGTYLPLKPSDGIPESLINIIETALAVNPAKRFATAEQMGLAMESVWFSNVKQSEKEVLGELAAMLK